MSEARRELAVVQSAVKRTLFIPSRIIFVPDASCCQHMAIIFCIIQDKARPSFGLDVRGQIIAGCISQENGGSILKDVRALVVWWYFVFGIRLDR